MIFRYLLIFCVFFVFVKEDLGIFYLGSFFIIWLEFGKYIIWDCFVGLMFGLGVDDLNNLKVGVLIIFWICDLFFGNGFFGELYILIFEVLGNFFKIDM